MTKLEKAKEVIRKHFKDAQGGIYDCRNWVGDPMTNVYDDGEISVDICYGHEYFEVFGLSDDEFRELAEYYASLDADDDWRFCYGTENHY